LADHPQEWLQDFAQAVLSWYDDKSYVEVTSSGSTGTPKKMQLSKSAMQASAEKTGKFLHLQDDIDFLAMTPHQLSTVLSQSPDQLHYVKKILLGGAPVAPTLQKKIAAIDAEVYLGYGMTETITHIAAKRLNGVNPDTSFHALPGINFSKTNEDCLIISADHLDENLSTTDIVRLKDKHTFDWLGRKDNVINSGGLKIHPERIEASLQSSIPYPFFIHWVREETLGQEVVICLETDKIVAKNDLDNAFERLGKYERPKKVICIPHFVYTATGKINRKESFKKTLIS